ncbi:hypothetical protein GPECTOR_101g28 [Gonium pectorale]|uniref:Pentatricopeptide repeat-containing protein n=1 Tax=Gonium pectorale TaxID=33097 RepID=A0A150FZW2_GONPE|nr:hypothetical protein GPECTOR_101g28 [Gonium pectorale]|eukprot:KXZ43127.1 hypothetical protein GPECTOR_101g28 [Gonium pectorale]
MVEESPAAGRCIAVCAARKHSPWTCDRTRKKNKAHLGSPEGYEALAEALEEEEELDDHEMNEQEVHVLASLHQLAIMGGAGVQDAGADGLHRAGSAPDGRRKVRGTRAGGSQVTSGFYSRLRQCALNGEGSPLAPAAGAGAAKFAASSTAGAAAGFTGSDSSGQENAPPPPAPLLFTAAEQPKCWLGLRHHSPIASAATEPLSFPHHHNASAPHRAATGVLIPAAPALASSSAAPLSTRFPAGAADQSLTAAAALAAVSRLTQSCFAGAAAGFGAAALHSAPDGSISAAAAGASAATGARALAHSLRYGGAFGAPSDAGAAHGGAVAVGGHASAPFFHRPNAVSEGSASGFGGFGGFGCFGAAATSVTAAGAGSGIGSGGHVGAAKALADSAGEMELRRLRQQPAPPAASFPSSSPVAACCHAASCPSALHAHPAAPSSTIPSSSVVAPRPLSLSSAGAASGGFGGGAASASWSFFPTAASGPALSAPLPQPAFDLAALAQSAGSVLFSAAPDGDGSVGVGGIRAPAAAAAGGLLSPVPQPQQQRSHLHHHGVGHHQNHHYNQHQHQHQQPFGSSLALGPFHSAPMPNDGALQCAAEGSPADRHMADDHNDHRPNRHNDLRDNRNNGNDVDDDEEETWLRTSQQTPDPDDPSSAGKFSAGLMRRVRDANANDELYGGIYGLYQSQDNSSGSGPRYGYGYAFRNTPTSSLKTGGSRGSLEPSPLPRLSSRLRRLRASPYGDAGSSGGRGGPPSASPTPSSSLGARCRSAGVTPGAGGGAGGGTGRRLRRRSDMFIDSGGLGSASTGFRRHHHGDDNDEDDDCSDFNVHGSPADQLFLDDGVSRHGGRGDGGPSTAAGGGSGVASRGHHQHQPNQRLSLQAPVSTGGFGAFSQQPTAAAAAAGGPLPCGAGALPAAAAGPLQRRAMLTGSLSQPALRLGPSAGGPHAAAGGEAGLGPGHGPRPQTHSGDVSAAGGGGGGGGCFLSGLMDYEDEGVEYSTPPHTPLRGVSGHHDHDHDAATAARALGGAADRCGGGGGDRAAAPPPPAAPPAPRDAAFGLLGAGGGRLFGGCEGAPPRVSFLRPAAGAAADCGADDTPALHHGGGGGSVTGGGGLRLGSSWQDGRDGGGGGGPFQWLAAETQGTVAEFNKWLGWAASRSDRGTAERLWQEMCSRGVAPDITTLNSLLRVLSRSAADPDDAQALVVEVCGRGGFSPNGTSSRLLDEICFRFEQLAAGADC